MKFQHSAIPTHLKEVVDKKTLLTFILLVPLFILRSLYYPALCYISVLLLTENLSCEKECVLRATSKLWYFGTLAAGNFLVVTSSDFLARLNARKVYFNLLHAIALQKAGSATPIVPNIVACREQFETIMKSTKTIFEFLHISMPFLVINMSNVVLSLLLAAVSSIRLTLTAVIVIPISVGALIIRRSVETRYASNIVNLDMSYRLSRESLTKFPFKINPLICPDDGAREQVLDSLDALGREVIKKVRVRRFQLRKGAWHTVFDCVIYGTCMSFLLLGAWYGLDLLNLNEITPANFLNCIVGIASCIVSSHQIILEMPTISKIHSALVYVAQIFFEDVEENSVEISLKHLDLKSAEQTSHAGVEVFSDRPIVDETISQITKARRGDHVYLETCEGRREVDIGNVLLLPLSLDFYFDTDLNILDFMTSQGGNIDLYRVYQTLQTVQVLPFIKAQKCDIYTPLKDLQNFGRKEQIVFLIARSVLREKTTVLFVGLLGLPVDHLKKLLVSASVKILILNLEDHAQDYVHCPDQLPSHHFGKIVVEIFKVSSKLIGIPSLMSLLCLTSILGFLLTCLVVVWGSIIASTVSNRTQSIMLNYWMKSFILLSVLSICLYSLLRTILNQIVVRSWKHLHDADSTRDQNLRHLISEMFHNGIGAFPRTFVLTLGCLAASFSYSVVGSFIALAVMFACFSVSKFSLHYSGRWILSLKKPKDALELWIRGLTLDGWFMKSAPGLPSYTTSAVPSAVPSTALFYAALGCGFASSFFAVSSFFLFVGVILNARQDDEHVTKGLLVIFSSVLIIGLSLQTIMKLCDFNIAELRSSLDRLARVKEKRSYGLDLNTPTTGIQLEVTCDDYCVQASSVETLIVNSHSDEAYDWAERLFGRGSAETDIKIARVPAGTFSECACVSVEMVSKEILLKQIGFVGRHNRDSRTIEDDLLAQFKKDLVFIDDIWDDVNEMSRQATLIYELSRDSTCIIFTNNDSVIGCFKNISPSIRIITL